MDSLWHFAGDKSVDTNWYTKRLSLLAIYKSTEVAMMQVCSDVLLNPLYYLSYWGLYWRLLFLVGAFKMATSFANCSLYIYALLFPWGCNRESYLIYFHHTSSLAPSKLFKLFILDLPPLPLSHEAVIPII